MTVPVLPQGLESLGSWGQILELRLDGLEFPQSPAALYPMRTASMTTDNAKTYTNCVVLATDLPALAFSNGVHWYRADTGGVIV